MEELYARWPFVALGFVVGGVSRGALGFGLPFVAVPVVASVLAPRLAIPLVALPTFFTNIIDIFILGRAEWRALARVWFYFLAGVCFVPVGSYFFFAVNPRWVRFLAGAVVVGYALFRLLHGRPLRFSRRGEYLLGGVVGAGGGFLAGSLSLPGAAHLVYLTALGLPRDAFIFIVSVFNSTVLLVQLVVLFAASAYSPPLLAAALLAILPAYAGFWLGFLLRTRIPQAAFQRCVLAGLLVLGLNLIARAWLG